MFDKFDARTEIESAIGEDVLRRWTELPDGHIRFHLDKKDLDNFIYGNLSLINFNLRVIELLAKNIDLSDTNNARKADELTKEYLDFAKSFGLLIGRIMLKAEAYNGQSER